MLAALSPLGFSPAAPALHAAARPSGISMAAERSTALPFLKKPPALDGSMIGDEGFDPLGISTTIMELGGDLKYAREAELMHGRQAMLASVGMFFPAVFGKVWGYENISDNPLIAQYELDPVITAQLFVSIAIAEGLRARIIFGEDRPAGDHGLDPAGFLTKMTPAQVDDMKLKELRHGRLAMIAFVGQFAAIAVTGHLWPCF